MGIDERGLNMKKRLVKKWLSRYINPVIKDLPKTNEWCAIESDGDKRTVYANNHTVINGKEVEEGGYWYTPVYSIRLEIKKTGEKLKEIVDKHKHVYHRIGPEIRGNTVRVRLITEYMGYELKGDACN